MKTKAQVTLEFTLTFIVIVAFVFGLISLWKWSADNIVQRQRSYNSQRLQAGSSNPGSPEIPYETRDVQASGYLR